ncbi:DUF4097 family beta strand repeat protein [Fulvivirga sp. 29W222]|uniref:DUF4097 family beta strand repeat protein n=1 Tax=Fulvivirga marina TaxID=2494733 RepID=A0A937KCH0_9BACT|nr:DUF4097 family beta strand repeat-containing protein [Fulvivirga marina]MBL6448141.1 DUF4097 family beta strand repeat protein [Fulvivirga marina]
MKKILTALTMLLILACAKYGYSQDNGELIVPFSDPSKKGKVRIEIKKGSIEVKGTDRSDVLIVYKGRKDKKQDDTKDGLKRISGSAMDMEVSEKSNYIDIESDSWSSGLDLVVEVPKSVDLHVETYNDGDLHISNINGEIVADNYNGKISAENIAGSIVANTYNGSIKARFDKVTPDTPMAFTTYNGDVDLTLPSNFKASLKMKTARGEIYSGFDFTVVKNEPETKTEKKSGTYKVYLDDWVRGNVNGGGPEFMIKNYNGDIYLRKK